MYSRRISEHANSIRIFLSSSEKLREDLFGTFAFAERKRANPSMKGEDSEDTSGNVARMLTHDEKFSSRILQDKDAGARRRWWRGWKGSGRVDACIDYLFSLLLARGKGRGKRKGCEKERTSPSTFEVHLPCLEEIRFFHVALLSLPTRSYSPIPPREKKSFSLFSSWQNFRPNNALATSQRSLNESSLGIYSLLSTSCTYF